MPTIKTLSEILADMGEPVSADSSAQVSVHHTDKNNEKSITYKENIQPKSNNTTQTNKHPSHRPTLKQSKNPKPSTTAKPKIDGILNSDTQNVLDAQTLNALQNVTIEPIYQNNKAVNRLRWLAFYYLSNKELSQKQLRQKLINKDCDADMVDALLDEFANKGYQSDERTAFMLIREGIRRGRGKRHITHSLRTAGLSLPFSLDELIQMADIDSLSDGTILENSDRNNSSDNSDKESVNWLKLAVEARCKKYGNSLPTDQKEKARQLRFLQYRGFDMGVCFDALKYTLDDMDELDFV